MASMRLLEASTCALLHLLAYLALLECVTGREHITVDTWQCALSETLESMLHLAENSSLSIPSGTKNQAQPGLLVLKTTAISAPENWEVVAEATSAEPSTEITEAAPICVIIPRAHPETLEHTSADIQAYEIEGHILDSVTERRNVSAQVVVSSRLLHAARLIRLARDFTVQRMSLPGLSHRRHPKFLDERPFLFHVYSPDELGGVLERVVEDESWGWTFRGALTNVSSVAKTDSSSPSSDLFNSVKRRECSFGLWGFSSKGGWHDREAAEFLFSFRAGIEVDLDIGDTNPPKTFPPSWYRGRQNKYGPLEDMPSPITIENKPDKTQNQDDTSPSSTNYTIVTAFSKNHYKLGVRLLNTILVHGPRSTIPFTVVAYTMEHMSREAHAQIMCLQDQYNKAGIPLVLREYNFDRIPIWMFIRHYKAGWWAWKGIMVWEVFVERGGAVLWLDAGDAISTPEAIPETFASLEQNGFVGIRQRWFGENYRWCKAQSTVFLGIDVSPHSPQCCGCLFGVTLRTYATILRPLFECSMTLQCIAPHGSNMGNHRQDQAILSVLASWNRLPCNGSSSGILWKCDSRMFDCSKPAEGEAAKICNIS